MNRHTRSWNSDRPVLITGGCGFVGCNLADALAARGETVLILDNLSRAGVEDNARWLAERHGRRVEVEVGDIRDADLVIRLVSRSRAVLHLAAQVAVTTSLARPLEDLDINIRGTVNVLEALRKHNPDAPLVYASTNKVYGPLLALTDVMEQNGRYVPRDQRYVRGVARDAPLDLYSPYGCSKGAADQYVRDYARVFGLRTAVLRMSCIYGPRQFGTEDQGWIAFFLIQALRRLPITIYGSGLQVRDALYIRDAVEAWLSALDGIDDVAGGIFNLGGGPANSISLLEMIGLIEEICGWRLEVRFDAIRPGDQPWYVSDIRAIAEALAWWPCISPRDGVRRLHGWLTGRLPQARALMQEVGL
ncbi:MAG: NAD-dependent epimerase/dehydratase family protein [Xanthobacteraceae bacterium]|nr:NAD-dependent epimerase/dehydratase family protein [Xanthobacteraceae bacterium]